MMQILKGCLWYGGFYQRYSWSTEWLNTAKSFHTEITLYTVFTTGAKPFV